MRSSRLVLPPRLSSPSPITRPAMRGRFWITSPSTPRRNPALSYCSAPLCSDLPACCVAKSTLSSFAFRLTAGQFVPGFLVRVNHVLFLIRLQSDQQFFSPRRIPITDFSRSLLHSKQNFTKK